MSEPLSENAGPSAVRPLVGRKISSRGALAFAVSAICGGVLLFFLLENHRTPVSAPTVATSADDQILTGAAVPALAIPAAQAEQAEYAYPLAAMSAPQPIVLAPEPAVLRRTAPPPAPSAPSAPFVPPYQLPTRVPTTVQQNAELYGYPTGGALRPGSVENSGKSDEATRAKAGYMTNPGFTIPRGSIIQAVLESAIDSTRSGMVRAIVSRDVRGFDGTRVLIPRGSRLIGEYRSDLAAGQNRAVVVWQRLLRTDGVTIDLESPATDALGRAGVKGKVNSQFFGRLGDAFLQSIFAIGNQLATREIAGNSGIYVMLPNIGGGGASDGVGPGSAVAQPNSPAQNSRGRTLTVRQGTSTAVFVAKDLDFSSVER